MLKYQTDLEPVIIEGLLDSQMSQRTPEMHWWVQGRRFRATIPTFMQSINKCYIVDLCSIADFCEAGRPMLIFPFSLNQTTTLDASRSARRVLAKPAKEAFSIHTGAVWQQHTRFATVTVLCRESSSWLLLHSRFPVCLFEASGCGKVYVMRASCSPQRLWMVSLKRRPSEGWLSG